MSGHFIFTMSCRVAQNLPKFENEISLGQYGSHLQFAQSTRQQNGQVQPSDRRQYLRHPISAEVT